MNWISTNPRPGLGLRHFTMRQVIFKKSLALGGNIFVTFDKYNIALGAAYYFNNHFVLYMNYRSLSEWWHKPLSQGNDPRGKGNHAYINKNKIPTGTTVIQSRPKKPPLSMFQKFLVDAFVSIVYPVH